MVAYFGSILGLFWVYFDVRTEAVVMVRALAELLAVECAGVPLPTVPLEGQGGDVLTWSPQTHHFQSKHLHTLLKNPHFYIKTHQWSGALRW